MMAALEAKNADNFLKALDQYLELKGLCEHGEDESVYDTTELPPIEDE